MAEHDFSSVAVSSLTTGTAPRSRYFFNRFIRSPASCPRLGMASIARGFLALGKRRGNQPGLNRVAKLVLRHFRQRSEDR